jgi:triphosphoribosyl-dephospho-CoA synthase
VHRYRDFDNLRYTDFLLSAAAIAPVLDKAPEQPIGRTILDCIRATRMVASTNSNLGIVLLLTPLAATPPNEDLRTGVKRILSSLDVDDSRLVYEAIRLARPGGLGRVPKQDVSAQPTMPLRDIMVLAADRDLVARQYANDFREVFKEGVPALRAGWQRTGDLETAIIYCHVHLLATFPDTLIARKRGLAEAHEASTRARQVLDAGWPENAAANTQLDALDAWLVQENHTRNPGTTADLVTASLYVAFRNGDLRCTPPPVT